MKLLIAKGAEREAVTSVSVARHAVNSTENNVVFVTNQICYLYVQHVTILLLGWLQRAAPGSRSGRYRGSGDTS